MLPIAHTPSPPLNAYVNCLYYCSAPFPYRRERILPLPTLDLKVNFGAPLLAYETDKAEPFAVCAESWWVGMWSEPHLVEWPEDTQFIMVEFKPGGAYPFLQLPVSELHNQVVSLDAIWGTFAAEIRERLYAAPTIEARFVLFEQFMLARLHEAPYGLDAVQYAIGEIARNHGAVSIRALSDGIGISQKHLIAQFKRMVGITPKELARLYRFQNVLYSIDPAQPLDWTWLAHQSMYYDQSHFNKDFESYSGYTPSEYLRLRQRVCAENPEHANRVRQMPTG